MASSTISPTAHYTGYVWQRHGLSDPRLATAEGSALHALLLPANIVSGAVGGPTLEQFLLARHHAIDDALAGAIERGEVGQVIEVAAGLSPRGVRFVERFGEKLVYVEADLPGMAARKREALGPLGPQHRVVELDALADDGPASLAHLAAGLDPAQGLAIVTEGLLNYFSREDVLGMWRRFAAALQGFPQGLYLSDLHLAEDHRGLRVRAFGLALAAFVRGRLHMHFEDAAEAQGALLAAGFDRAAVRRTGDDSAGARLVHVVEASVGPAVG